MILLLGDRKGIEEYIDKVIEKDEDSVILCFPCVFDHHTEYGKYADEIKLEKPDVVVTQNSEVVDVLLESDLEFNVVTLKNINRNIYERVMRKKEALELRDEFNFDLRD